MSVTVDIYVFVTIAVNFWKEWPLPHLHIHIVTSKRKDN